MADQRSFAHLYSSAHTLYSTGVFVAVISGSSDLQTTYKFSIINVVVSLAGYYMGALLLDTKAYGRKWIQINGLAVIFILFLISAILYPQLTAPSGIKYFQAIFFMASFATQFGREYNKTSRQAM